MEALYVYRLNLSGYRNKIYRLRTCFFAGLFRVAHFLLIISLIFQSLFLFPASVYAASSPWTQTDWVGGSGQTSWSDATKFDSSSSVTTSTAGQITLTNTEEFSNTGFETDLSSWNSFSATGGTITTSSGYTIHTFTGSGTFTTNRDGSVEYLVVAGGGGGGGGHVDGWAGGSGGAGGYRTGTGLAVTTQAYTITVGAGGAGGGANTQGVNGGNSVISTITSIGGGGGGRSTGNGTGAAGSAGGSGGGGAGNLGANTAGGAGTAEQGFDGKGSINLTNDPGGGGGASSTGGNSINNTPGVGGTGTSSSISGSSVTYAAGGGVRLATPVAGGNNTGNGGSSNGGSNPGTPGSAGGSGIVILRYPTTTLTRDTNTTYSSSVGSAKLVTSSTGTGEFTQSVNVGDTNQYNLSAYAYTDGSAVTSSDVELFYNGSTVSTTYTSVGSGWYQLTGTVTGANASRAYGVQVKANKTVYLDNFSLNNYVSSGTLTSSIFDTEQLSNWGTLTYSATTPSNTSVSVKARSSNSSSMTGATDFSSCTAITSGADISSNNCITDTHRYIQYYLTLANTDSVSTPTFQDISIAFTASDSTAPSISLTALSPDPNTDTTPTLTGTATEAVGTVASVQFQVDSTAGSWTACTANDGTFNSTSEAFSCTASSALSDGSHTMYVRATDSNGNTTSNGSASTDTFTIDTTTPSTPGTPSTTSPTADSTPTWSWTASTDATSGLAATPYTLQWSQSSSFSSGVSSTTSTTNAFTHSTPLTDGTWYFRVKAADAAGNESSYSSSGSVQINTGAPTGTVTINSGSGNTNSRTVTLTISASSGFFSSTSDIQMKISNLSDLSDASYEAFASSKSWTLTSGDGTKTVYVQFKDTTNNESGAYTDTITLDTVAPNNFDLQSPGSNSFTNSERPSFSWKAASTPDATAGLSKYKLEIDNGDTGDITIDDISPSRTSPHTTTTYHIDYDNFSDNDSSNNTITVHLDDSVFWGSGSNYGKLKEGKRNWKVIAYDNAGNTTTEARAVFIDRTAPSVSVSKINDVPFSSNSFTTTDKTPMISGKITDSRAGDKTENKVVSGPKSVEVKIEQKNNQGKYDVHTIATVNLNESYWTDTGVKITDNSQNTSDKYSPFEFTPKTALSFGEYKVTIIGKDNADITGGETTLYLTISSFDTVATPEQKEVVEKEIEKEAPNISEEKKQEVKESVKLTKPTEPKAPSFTEKAGKSISAAGKGALDATGNFISSIATGIGNGTKAVLNGIGSGIGFVFNKTGQGLAYVGNGIVTGLSNTSEAIGNGYNSLAQHAPGVVKTALVAIGDGVSATGNAINTTAGNTGQGIKNTGTSIVQGVNNATNATKEGIANIAFFIGEKTQDVSEGAGFAIVKFGYNFVNEPTTIADVKVEILSPASAKVSWQTNHPANGKVNYGLDETYPFDIQTEKRTNHHEFVLTNLKPNTEYHFEVMSHNKNYVYDANRKFKTPK